MAHPLELADGENIRLRFQSALILAPLSLVFAGLGGGWFTALVLVCGLIGLHEWLSIIIPGPPRRLLAAGAAAMGLVILAYEIGGAGPGVLAGVLGGALLPFAAPSIGASGRLWAVIGVVYLAAAAVALLWLRALPDLGLSLIVFLLASVWATDVAAFLVGREVGGPRLWRDVSPSKTWAGLAGGMAAAGLTGGLVAFGCGAASVATAAGVAMGLALVGQAGDLFESTLKRRYNVKDSGTLIPGHGGLLDRIDGLLAAAPALALFHASLGASVGWW